MKVFGTTNEVIWKITRYANQLSEQNNSAASRREEYRKFKLRPENAKFVTVIPYVWNGRERVLAR